MNIMATSSLIALTKALYVAMTRDRFTPTSQNSLSSTSLSCNICSTRNNIFNVIHGNSRNVLTKATIFTLSGCTHVLLKYLNKYLLWNSLHLWTSTLYKKYK